MTTKTKYSLSSLNSLFDGWTESRPDGLICNPDIRGGIIDCEIVSQKWFVIFNDGREIVSDLNNREDAIKFFIDAAK